MGDVSDAEIVRIANGFLMDAPPGEFMEVVTDLRGLLPKESLLNDSAPQTFKNYNSDHMIQVDVNGKKAIITKYNEIGDNTYLDATNKQSFKFDHIRQEVSSVSGADVPTNALRDALERETVTYCSEHFPNGSCGVFLVKSDIFICISAARFNAQNFWNGRWRSVWKIENNGSKITGRLRLNVHYYEEGNVQLVTDTNKTVPGSSDAKAIISAIKKVEQEFEVELEQSYNTMGTNTFKALRRALPMTATKINWNSIKSYSLGKDMK